jgi:hypothetical protein
VKAREAGSIGDADVSWGLLLHGYIRRPSGELYIHLVAFYVPYLLTYVDSHFPPTRSFRPQFQKRYPRGHQMRQPAIVWRGPGRWIRTAPGVVTSSREADDPRVYDLETTPRRLPPAPAAGT